ncbi:MAG: type III pantothenate kinase [Prevotellaceae bacterium]|jgi:type III pantothenate kinase|nr:type III pantothenate kinase [Prevotellaceae bacterium]
MYSLIIDIGNSRSKIFAVESDKPKIVYSAIYENPDDLKKVFTLYPQIRNGIYSATGHVDGNMTDFLNAKLDKLIRFTSEIPVPIKNSYKTPETLGSDRLATAVGANLFFPDTNLVIFDFGTAITVDFVDADGSFTGGNISPGLSVRFKALNCYTNSLPLLSPPEKITEIGTCTKTAIEAGVVHGIIGETMYYIKKYPSRKIIFTGGDAFYFARQIKCPIFVFSNSAVFGLNKILIHNCTEI